jgi:hypothetical protein
MVRFRFGQVQGAFPGPLHRKPGKPARSSGQTARCRLVGLYLDLATSEVVFDSLPTLWRRVMESRPAGETTSFPRSTWECRLQRSAPLRFGLEQRRGKGSKTGFPWSLVPHAHERGKRGLAPGPQVSPRSPEYASRAGCLSPFSGCNASVNRCRVHSLVAET